MTRAAILWLLLLHPVSAQPAPGGGAAGSGPHACIRPTGAATCIAYEDPYHAGCGSRGGPGCRKEDGRCAAWRDGFAPDCRQQRPGGDRPADLPTNPRTRLPPATLDAPSR